ncbi:phage head-tail joining protein [Burkholderia sp. BDU5]|uniref:phage head-tail joining protein n=1 Tax=Burkholderia sp. BDU5 TaxID=1385590 RepID=UPI0007547241|nr:hypothetical protein [Burkholderia sp. BDU5]KVE45459.1 hypothetical protein WS69_18185 [Burkholderia sp. BDU5]
MAFTQNDLIAVERAIASGALTVEYNGKKTTFRSIADLLAARDLIKADVDAAAGGSRRPRSSIAIIKRF